MLRQIIAHFSKKERTVFMLSLVIFSSGVFSGLVALSNHFTVVVPRSGGTYREGIIGSPRFINPLLANSDADKDLTSLIYSGLVRIGEDGVIIPDLAESWDISSDGKTYTVRLKKDLVFHDGKPLTAQDIVFTVSKIATPSLKSPLRISWNGVLATAPDDATVVFTLQKPYSGFLNQLSLGILPMHIWKNIEDTAWQTSTYTTEPIGSGPYKISHIARDNRGAPESYTLTSFGKFALGKPFIKKLIIECLTNSDDAVRAYTKRSITGVAGLTPTDALRIMDNDTTNMQTSMPHVFGIFFNQGKNKAFSDPAVIKALNLAVNKEALIDAVFSGYATSLNGPLPSSVDTAPSDYATKKSLATKTLDAAGWVVNPSTSLREKTFGKEKVVLTFSLATANTPELEKSGQMIVEMYRDIGVHVDLKVFEIGTLNENVIRGRDFQALLFGQVVKHDTDIYAFWHSSQKTAPGLNITGYTNKRVDSLLESTLQESSSEKRNQTFMSIAQELAKDAPVVFLYTPNLIYLTDTEVHHLVLPTISEARDRFSLIHEWYLYTDRVWKGLVK